MIKYIGNYSSWLDSSLVNYIIDNEGEPRPNFNTTDQRQLDTFQTWIDAGFDTSKISWQFHVLPEHLPPNFKFKLPIEHSGDFGFWFSKLKPGDIFPLHVDTVSDKKNYRRLWMACQDHLPGHIFTFEGKFLEGYKAGDMFEFANLSVQHGAANIGFTTKVSLQIILFD